MTMARAPRAFAAAMRVVMAARSRPSRVLAGSPAIDAGSATGAGSAPGEGSAAGDGSASGDGGPARTGAETAAEPSAG